MSIAAIVLRGYGPVADVVELPLRGYGSDAEAPPATPGETTPAAEGEIGGAKAGMNMYDRKSRSQIEDEEFIQIIQIALPEIMKYLK
jgi:hypothetical protein